MVHENETLNHLPQKNSVKARLTSRLRSFLAPTLIVEVNNFANPPEENKTSQEPVKKPVRKRTTNPLRFSKDNATGLHSHPFEQSDFPHEFKFSDESNPSGMDSFYEEFTEKKVVGKKSDKSNDVVGVGLLATGIGAALLGAALIGAEIGKKQNGQEINVNNNTIIFEYNYPQKSIEIVLPSASPIKTAEPLPTPSATPKPTETPTPTEKPTPTPTASPTENPTPLEFDTQNPFNGEPNQVYTLDAWYLIDGDVDVKGANSNVFQRTYDDLEESAEEIIAGPGSQVIGKYGFSAITLFGDDQFVRDDRNSQIINTNMDNKFDDINVGPNGDYQFSYISLDLLNADGTISHVDTVYRK